MTRRGSQLKRPLESQIIKEGKSSQIIMEVDENTIAALGVEHYKNKFKKLKDDNKIINCEFEDNVWTLTRKRGHVANIKYGLDVYKEALTTIKCMVVMYLENGLEPNGVLESYLMLERSIINSNCFNRHYIEYFESYLDSCTESQLRVTKTAVTNFLTYYKIDKADDYWDVIDNIKSSASKVRELPDYRSILIFHEIIWEEFNDKEKGLDEKLKLKYYPLYLWWRITSVIPLRPTEFLELEVNCCWKDEYGVYRLKLPREKVEQPSSKNIIEIQDVIEATKDIYELIEDYKRLLKEKGYEGKYLLSYKAYNSYFTEWRAAMAESLKVDADFLELKQINIIFDMFYDEIIETKHKKANVNKLKPGDSRHLAFCKLLFEGYDPLTIARLGGHSNLESQCHYYGHMETFAQSFVNEMSHRLQMFGFLYNRRASGFIEKVTNSQNYLVTISAKELDELLEIEQGYCKIKKKGCDDFTDCPDDCWYCCNHIIDTKKYPEAKEELQVRSDELSRVIKEQILLLESVYKNIFIDFSKEQTAHTGVSRLKNASAQLEKSLSRKTYIDAYLLGFISENKVS